jgi:hypothetical protein
MLTYSPTHLLTDLHPPGNPLSHRSGAVRRPGAQT